MISVKKKVKASNRPKNIGKKSVSFTEILPLYKNSFIRKNNFVNT